MSDTATTTGETMLRDDAPATRPVPALNAGRLAAAIGDEVSSTDPYLAVDEPTVAEATNLYQQVLAASAPVRLDLILDALRTAYRRGRAAERREVSALALEHVDRFRDAVRERHDAEFRRDAAPWWQR